MKTSITNRIRTVMDEWLPRSLRNARWFMAPFFAIWFKGRNVRLAMDFKQLAPSMSDAEFRDAYERVTTLGDDRVTDTHPEAMAYAIASLDSEAKTLLDVGSGRGFFLTHVHGLTTFACDLGVRRQSRRFAIAMAERLPFATSAFDVVTCFHTLEHTRDLTKAIAELKRVARKQIIVIVPRQKRFEYTFDLHLQFFPTAEALEEAMRMRGEIKQFGDDLVYISRP